MNRLYVVTRRDLPPGAQAAQGAHGVVEFLMAHAELGRAWFTGGNNLVLLAAPDQTALLAILARAREAGVHLAECREPDLGDELTAVALGEEGRKLVSSLPLALRTPRCSRCRGDACVLPTCPRCD